jgi:outer membrane protein assembly factor BamD
MQYLKAMSYYNRIVDIVKAQDDAKLASYGFRELIARFPNTEYASDAKERLIFVDDHLAGAKMSVGRYQIKTANYVGAIGNFSYVINRYARTNQAEEAHLRLIEIYYKIGLKPQAVEILKQMEESYPNSKWLVYAKKININ